LTSLLKPDQGLLSRTEIAFFLEKISFTSKSCDKSDLPIFVQRIKPYLIFSKPVQISTANWHEVPFIPISIFQAKSSIMDIARYGKYFGIYEPQRVVLDRMNLFNIYELIPVFKGWDSGTSP
jgi:hypothetical protein